MASIRSAIVSAVLIPLSLIGQPAATAEQPTAKQAGSAGRCIAGTGPYQRFLESYLRLPVDGVQTTSDCEAIQRFQSKQGVRPADGSANLWTYRMMLVAQAGKNPNKGGMCPVRDDKVTCIDMNRQLLWVQKGRNLTFGPVPIRTGRDTQETRLGWHNVYWKHKDHYSGLYNNAPMPYSQFFDGGQAIHGSLTDLYNGGGSAGCVNLRLADAKALWGKVHEGDRVFIWGTKPGTYRSGT